LFVGRAFTFVGAWASLAWLSLPLSTTTKITLFLSTLHFMMDSRRNTEKNYTQQSNSALERGREEDDDDNKGRRHE
jgi:hypothetical protein